MKKLKCVSCCGLGWDNSVDCVVCLQVKLKEAMKELDESHSLLKEKDFEIKRLQTAIERALNEPGIEREQ